jgi:hypothetical protein
VFLGSCDVDGDGDEWQNVVGGFVKSLPLILGLCFGVPDLTKYT